jgi:hypothetical protein
MPSSISNSDELQAQRNLDVRRATIVLIAIAVGLSGLAEIAARVGLSRFSQIHRRIMEDQRAANEVRPANAGQPKTMLAVGNSLLLEGVNFAQLADRTSSRFRPTRFVVEQTSYYDWFFGLRRLFRQGVRPDYLVLCLSPGQLRVNTIRGDFDARFLFGLQDIWPLTRAIDANLTTTSSLYFAHASTFYGARSELRSVFMGKIGLMPVQQLWHDLVTVPLVEKSEDMTPLYASRLKMLSDLCAMHGVRFLFLIPPTAQPGDKEVVRAGERAHATVLRPVPNYSLGPEYYRDSFHLNARGANIFTSKIADALANLP